MAEDCDARRNVCALDRASFRMTLRFAYDPEIPTRCNAVLWRPQVFPGVVLLTEALSGFAAAPFSAAGIDPVFDDRADAEGRESSFCTSSTFFATAAAGAMSSMKL